jgi:GT2 family glycosyltransferase/lipopolysaccharide/colanic/teichoic acid biosynthesis glycosyltransferase
MTMLDLSIIIVNYNVKEFLQNLLDSLYTGIGNLKAEIIVIDNNSEDGSADVIKQKYPGVTLIENKQNIGFGAANNLGMKLAKGRYFLLINPDAIIQEDTLEKMSTFMDSTPNAGMAGCKVLNPDGTLQLPCRRSFPGPWTSFTKMTGLSSLFPKSRIFARYNLTYLDENQTYEVDAISGAFMFIRRETYEKIGGFDPIFFMYGEDLDLCYRTQKSGYKIYYVHTAKAIHYKGESSKRSNIDETKNFYKAMHLFVKKHLSSSLLVQAILRVAIILRSIVAFVNVNKLPIISAILDFIFINAAIYLSGWIYFYKRWHGFPDFAEPVIYTVPALIQIALSFISGAYNRRSLSILRVLYSIILGFFIISALTFFFKEYAFSRALVLLVYAIAFITLPFWRILAKIFFRAGIENRGLKKINTAIIGVSENSINLSQKLRKQISGLRNVVGYIDDSMRRLDETIEGIKVIGSINNIQKVIAEYEIDEIIFPAKPKSYAELFSIISACKGNNVEFKVAGEELDFMVGKSAITLLDELPLLDVQYNISDTAHKAVKFIMDKVLALIFLIFISPFGYLYYKFTKKRTSFVLFFSEMHKVLSGQLSLVGPKNHSASDGLYLGKKGVTGLWLLEDINEDSSDELLKLDIFYAKNQNIWLDFEILGKTFSRMLN